MEFESFHTTAAPDAPSPYLFGPIGFNPNRPRPTATTRPPLPSTSLRQPEIFTNPEFDNVLQQTVDGYIAGPISNPYVFVPVVKGEVKEKNWKGENETQKAYAERQRCLREIPGCRCNYENCVWDEEIGQWEEVEMAERRRRWRAQKFEGFGKLPPELKVRVVQLCDVGDAVCLSLASKEMYDLAKPTLAKIEEAYTLNWRHTLRPHGHTVHEQPNLITKPYWCTSAFCRSHPHCSCISCPLYTRLSTWILCQHPTRILKFCKGSNYSFYGWNNARNNHCGKFTYRTKSNNYQCKHGGGKWPCSGRKKTGFPLAYRGYFHNAAKSSYWKMGYTEANMAKAMDRWREPRSEESMGGYGLRKRPKPSKRRMEHFVQRTRRQKERSGGYDGEDEDVEMSE